MMSTIICKKCGMTITFTDLESKVINAASGVLIDKGLKFNLLILADQMAECCKQPDYHF